MPLVTDKLSDVKLLIVGEFYEPRKIYDDIIRKLKIGNSVKITDRYVDNEEVEVYFKAADLVVLPYLSATQSGITQIAKAFGKPVVSTDVGGLSEVVEDGVNGYLVPPGNSLALADKIVESFRRNLFVSRWEKITYKQNESVPGKRIATLVDAAMRGDPDGLFSHGKVESND
jgi:glycosyltransferase involved in cell wall biosynthesis